MGAIKRKCDNCGKEYNADTRNLRRGWGRCCCKSCAAQLREKRKPGYNPKRVAINNVRVNVGRIARKRNVTRLVMMVRISTNGAIAILEYMISFIYGKRNNKRN